ncbi:hypothetical protein [Streptomyces sp. NPDC001930]|uniref:hypothetical protein n=1 Tax=Streptomyces sp. NPDC001930 TaxID=3364625 RepID=UPI0036C1E7EC
MGDLTDARCLCSAQASVHASVHPSVHASVHPSVPASAAAFASAAADSPLTRTGPVLMRRAGASAIGASLLPVGDPRVAPAVSRRVIRRLVTTVLPKLFPDEPGPSRQDFVGQTINLRGERTDRRFGQA